MSTGVYKDVWVDCNRKGCTVTAFGSHLGLKDGMTAADVRQVLRRAGWRVSVAAWRADPSKVSALGSVVDFCPDHAAPEHWKRALTRM